MKRFEKLERARPDDAGSTAPSVRARPDDSTDASAAPPRTRPFASTASTDPTTGTTDDESPAPAAPKRFSAIERARPDAAAAAGDPFKPPPVESAPIQLELHDRYSEKVEDARRTRKANATQQLVVLEAERAAKQAPHRAPDLLDLAARGASVGPLARLGTETRLGIVMGALLATWFALALTLGAGPAVIGVLVLAAIVVIRGAR